MRTMLVLVTVLVLVSSMRVAAVGATPTPTPASATFPMQGDCTASPCGGSCIVCPPCTPGSPCPAAACVLGQCQMLSDGCTCIPGNPFPTPAATPTPIECDQNCAPGSRCGQFPCGQQMVQGVCESSDSGCICVPPSCVVPMPTPTLTAGVDGCGASCDSRPCKGQCPDGSFAPGFCTALTIDRGCACAPDCGTPLPTPPFQSCSASACEGPCTLPVPCPLGVPCPMQLGQCEPSASGDCECVPVVQTPSATPTPQCSEVPCGGDCVISFPCTAGSPCPGAPVQLGQCESTSGGGCECIPVGPTPMPTPTPQCTGASCGGPCTIAFPPLPCPRPGICNGADVPVLSGQCEMTASGDCACIPVSPTPTATPTPQCADATCSGPCAIPVPCPPGLACPQMAQLGQCEPDDAGDCQCIPVGPTPGATPTPECSGETSGGPCTISVPPFPCPAGKICNGPTVLLESGQCELNASGDCECVPETPPPSPTPLATPTPQCDAVPCGGQCVIAPPCASRGCEVPDLLGTCEMVSGSCTCVPAAVPATDSAPVHRSPHHRRQPHPRIASHTIH